MPHNDVNIAIAYLLIVAGVMVWALLLRRHRRMPPQLLDLSISAGGAFLLGICFADLVPEAFSTTDRPLLVAGFVLLGLVVQIVIDHLTNGAEHGHQHDNEETHVQHRHFPLTGLMLGLCIHSFFEGIPLIRLSSESHLCIDRGLLLGIILHNLPIGYILVQCFLQNQIRQRKAVGLLSLFALMTPLGSLLSITVLSEHNTLMEACAIAFVVGILLHVSQNLIFDHHSHTFSWRQLGVIVGSFALALLINLV